MSFVMDIETFFVTYFPEYATALPVVTYAAYALCAVMASAFISTLGVRIMIGSNIGVRNIVGGNI